ncbi:uncharacterized protein LOC111690191 [Lucilia cuprina]|uniref:uncharacterized protein LOC111690191 n=1 Tax=Lucilia cuprina TaxID=7375 RepID=UPI001F05A47E|nr:uncharacterized protein LOC111690191 [Lucilia cuprina]
MKTSLEPQVNKLLYYQNNRRQNLCEYKNDHVAANELTQFVRINRNPKKQTRKGFGHSQMATNNFSRRNSAATVDSTVSSTNTLSSVLAARTATPVALANNHRKHSLKSWSMSHLKNDCKVNSNAKLNKQITNYEFTEQRCNYERMTQQQHLQQQQQRSWSPAPVIRCNVSNSRTPTCLVDQNQKLQHLKTTKFCDALNADFLALNEFRMQNSKYCFSDRHKSLLRSQTSPAARYSSGTQQFELNCVFNDFDDVGSSKSLKDNENVTKSLASSFSSLSLTTSSTMPYYARQRILREQLAKDCPHRKSIPMGINKSAALSYQL